VGLKRGPLSLVRITEELLQWKSSGSGLENRDYWPWESVALTTRHPLSANLALTLPKSDGRSVGIVRLRTKRPRSFFFCNREDNRSLVFHGFTRFLTLRKVFFLNVQHMLRFPAGTRCCSLHSVRTGSRAHPASQLTDTGGSFKG
jgi:hypothetical protein